MNFGQKRNPLLTCIQVDSVNYSASTWFRIDPWSSFGTNCLVGTEESDNQSEVSIYPNPVINELIINSRNGLSFKVEIYNCLGEIIYSAFLNGELQKINLSDLISGFYILKLIDSRNTTNIKRFSKL